MICLPLPRSSAGRAEEHDLAGQLVGDGRQRDRRADARRGHRVVAAAVAETGQGVVLGQDPDPRAVAAAAAAAGRPDRRREAARRVLDREPVRAQDLGDPGRGLVLLERRLRVGVDPMRQVDDLVAGGLDGRGHARLDVGVGLGGADGDQRSGTGPPGTADCGSAAGAAAADGSAGRRTRSLSVPPRASPRPRREGHDEQGDRQLQGALQPQHDEDRDDAARPSPATGGPRPVAAVGDPPVPAEDDEPQDRDRGQRRRPAR